MFKNLRRNLGSICKKLGLALEVLDVVCFGLFACLLFSYSGEPEAELLSSGSQWPGCDWVKAWSGELSLDLPKNGRN